MKLTMLLIIALTFAACAPASTHQPTPAIPSQPNELAGTRWVLLSYGLPDADIAVVEGNLITLEFGAQGQVAGSGICNSYAAQYDIQSNTLTFDNITSTWAVCEGEAPLQQESEYLQALKSAGAFERTNDRLMISYNSGNGMLTFYMLDASLAYWRDALRRYFSMI